MNLRFRKLFAASIAGAFLMTAACGGSAATKEETPSAAPTAAAGTQEGEGAPDIETETVSEGNAVAPPGATPTPVPDIHCRLGPMTKVDGEMYLTYPRGQADRFRVKEENYLGEILYYVPEGVTADSPDFSSETLPVGAKVYRDAEDETVLWFVQYHEEDNYNGYSRGKLYMDITEKITPAV